MPTIGILDDMPRAEERDYERLATIARRRRAELGLALNDSNAKAGGLSNRTWQRVEKGLEIRETNYVKIDGLMGWAPGSSLLILEGGEPAPAKVDGFTSPAQQSAVDRDTEGEARDVVQLAIIATSKDATAEEIRAMSERVVQDLRDRGLI